MTRLGRGYDIKRHFGCLAASPGMFFTTADTFAVAKKMRDVTKWMSGTKKMFASSDKGDKVAAAMKKILARKEAIFEKPSKMREKGVEHGRSRERHFRRCFGDHEE